MPSYYLIDVWDRQVHGISSPQHRFAVKTPAGGFGDAEADFQHQAGLLGGGGAHVEAEGVFDEAGAGLAGQGDGVVLAVIAHDLLGGMADKQRQLVLQGAAAVAALDEDMRPRAFVDIDQVEEDLQHAPVVEIEMVAEGGPAEVGFRGRSGRKAPPDPGGDDPGLSAEIMARHVSKERIVLDGADGFAFERAFEEMAAEQGAAVTLFGLGVIGGQEFELAIEVAEAGGRMGEGGNLPVDMVGQDEIGREAVGLQGADDGIAFYAGKQRRAGCGVDDRPSPGCAPMQIAEWHGAREDEHGQPAGIFPDIGEIGGDAHRHALEGIALAGDTFQVGCRGGLHLGLSEQSAGASRQVEGPRITGGGNTFSGVGNGGSGHEGEACVPSAIGLLAVNWWSAVASGRRLALRRQPSPRL